MRTATTLAFLLLLLLMSSGTQAASATKPTKTEHPANVALLEQPTGWTYVQFPSNLRLYVNDQDKPGKSLCNEGCQGAWPPLTPTDIDVRPVGHWTQIRRDDGSHQWAYKGRPVYLRFHDSIEQPTGDGVDGVWRFLKP